MMKHGRRADVLVIGAGGAGLMAAVEAADAGASVTILESESEVGGSKRLSGANVVLCEITLQSGSRSNLLQDLLESHNLPCKG